MLRCPSRCSALAAGLRRRLTSARRRVTEVTDRWPTTRHSHASPAMSPALDPQEKSMKTPTSAVHRLHPAHRGRPGADRAHAHRHRRWGRIGVVLVATRRSVSPPVPLIGFQQLPQFRQADAPRVSASAYCASPAGPAPRALVQRDHARRRSDGLRPVRRRSRVSASWRMVWLTSCFGGRRRASSSPVQQQDAAAIQRRASSTRCFCPPGKLSCAHVADEGSPSAWPRSRRAHRGHARHSSLRPSASGDGVEG